MSLNDPIHYLLFKNSIKLDEMMCYISVKNKLLPCVSEKQELIHVAQVASRQVAVHLGPYQADLLTNS